MGKPIMSNLPAVIKKDDGHAKLSASGSERWLNCPGSVKLSEDAPPQADSICALEGTKAHGLHEKWATHLRDKKSAFVIPKGYERDMVDAVSTSIDFVKANWTKGETELLVEEKVELNHVGDDMWGTTDIGIVEHFGTLWVVDYKHGQGHAVDISWISEVTKTKSYNTQLLYYAIGLAHKYDYNFDKIKIAIVQPRAQHDKGPIRIATMTPEKLKGYEGIFKKGVDRVYGKNPKLHAGPWCQWCPAASFCPEITKAAFNDAQLEFSEVKNATIELPAPDKLSPMQLSKLLESAQLLDVWIKAVRNHAYQLLAVGKEVPGFKIVRGRKSRKWTNENEAAEMLELMFDDAAYKKTLLSVAQAEKELGKKKFRGLSKMVVYSEGLLTMVKASDKREAVDTVGSAFDETPNKKPKRVAGKQNAKRSKRK